MGETHGCCSAYEQQQHEQQLQKASRRSTRGQIRKYPEWSKYDDGYVCYCCGCCERKVAIHDASVTTVSSLHQEHEMCEYKVSSRNINLYNKQNRLIAERVDNKNDEIDDEIDDEEKHECEEESLSIMDYANMEINSVSHSPISAPVTLSPLHSLTIPLPLNRFATLKRSNSVQCLINLDAIKSVYVAKDKYSRWNEHHSTWKRIRECDSLNVPYHTNKNNPDYKEMKCFLLKNFKINKVEFDDFKRVILDAIEMCPQIYVLNFNSATMDTSLLAKLLNILKMRYQNKHKTANYGPEIVDLENLPIKNVGLELICNYIEADCQDTKWLKIGRCRGYEITAEMSGKVVDSLQKNTHVLKIDIELSTKLRQDSKKIRQHLKQNSWKWET